MRDSRLVANSQFIEAPVVVLKTQKHKVGVYTPLWYLNYSLSISGRLFNLVQDAQHFGRTYSFQDLDLTIPFGFGFDGSFRISEGLKPLVIQMVETILHVRLYYLFLKEIKKTYSSVTKRAKQSPNFATRASFVLLLDRVVLALSRVVLSCLVLCCVVLVLRLVVLVLCRVVSRCLLLYMCCVVLSRVVTRVVYSARSSFTGILQNGLEGLQFY